MEISKVRKKGQGYMLSAVLYLAIFTAGVAIVYNTLYPKVNEMMFKSEFQNTLDSLYYLHQNILDVSRQAEGAMKEVPLYLRVGELFFLPKENKIRWVVEGKKDVLRFGEPYNSVFKVNYGDGVKVEKKDGYYIMENDKIIVNISDNGGSEGEFKPINVSATIASIYNKKEKKKIVHPIRLLVNGDEYLETGTGYVYAKELGDDLEKGRVYVHVNTSIMSYTIEIGLDEGADFITIRLID